MAVIDEMYEEARRYGASEEDTARQYVNGMSIEDLRKEFVQLTGMVAYYSKLERVLSANPRTHYDVIRECMRELDADTLMQQAEIAAQSGMELSGLARVKTKPLLKLLHRVNAILG
jgi:hypothetical protein